MSVEGGGGGRHVAAETEHEPRYRRPGAGEAGALGQIAYQRPAEPARDDGDRVLVYSTAPSVPMMRTAEVVAEAYPDPRDERRHARGRRPRGARAAAAAGDPGRDGGDGRVGAAAPCGRAALRGPIPPRGGRSLETKGSPWASRGRSPSRRRKGAGRERIARALVEAATDRLRRRPAVVGDTPLEGRRFYRDEELLLVVKHRQSGSPALREALVALRLRGTPSWLPCRRSGPPRTWTGSTESVS